MTEVTSKQKRNRIILIVVLVFIVLCAVTCGVAYFALEKAIANTMKVEPEQAKNLATQIADYDIPAGYKEVMGSSTFGLTMAAIADSTEKNMIWLIQSPSNRLPDPENFLQKGIAYEQNNPISWKSVDVFIYPIRGEKSSITKYDGTTKDGKRYHSWMGKFMGKGGNALLVIVGPDETWDEKAAEAFIRSMR